MFNQFLWVLIWLYNISRVLPRWWNKGAVPLYCSLSTTILIFIVSCFIAGVCGLPSCATVFSHPPDGDERLSVGITSVHPSMPPTPADAHQVVINICDGSVSLCVFDSVEPASCSGSGVWSFIFVYILNLLQL